MSPVEAVSPANIQIGDVLLFNRYLETGEVTTLEQFLAAKHGVTLA